MDLRVTRDNLVGLRETSQAAREDNFGENLMGTAGRAGMHEELAPLEDGQVSERSEYWPVFSK